MPHNDLDDIDDDDLIEELQSRAKRKGLSVSDYVETEGGTKINPLLSRTRKELQSQLAIKLGLNELASKEDIINEINEKL